MAQKKAGRHSVAAHDFGSAIVGKKRVVNHFDSPPFYILMTSRSRGDVFRFWFLLEAD